ncbi:MAG: MBOAT family protein [Bacteroidales bacterium]|nr:MBOAT family protein [Bacteroidales bacterium]
MEFNSLNFLLFFMITFAVYHLCYQKTKVKNIVLLVASYVFYGIADLKMIPVIAVMTIILYFLGVKIEKFLNDDNDQKAHKLAVFSAIIGLLPLFYFKYFGFSVESFAKLFSTLGFNTEISSFRILMPLGISFFTFRLVSYVLEIGRRKMSAEKDFLSFATYVAFFPCIMAGPIDRPNKFLPQLKTPRVLDSEFLTEGVRLFVWGWFTKVCIADRMGEYVDAIFGNYQDYGALSIGIAALIYPLQMYADFSGYSNMAIGIGRLLGIEVAENFRRPFFAQNVAEYWRRWHISLTGWLTDYVFMPLNIKFRDYANLGLIMAVIINLIAVGFWHGANWTFGFFGLYHGLLFIPLVLSGKMNKKTKITWIKGWLISPQNFLKMALTYCLVALGLVFFRAESIGVAFDTIGQCFTGLGAVCKEGGKLNIAVFMFSLMILCVKDYLDEGKFKFGILKTGEKVWFTNLQLIGLIIFILIFRGDAVKEFIYMQF